MTGYFTAYSESLLRSFAYDRSKRRRVTTVRNISPGSKEGNTTPTDDKAWRLVKQDTTTGETVSSDMLPCSGNGSYSDTIRTFKQTLSLYKRFAKSQNEPIIRKSETEFSFGSFRIFITAA